MNKLKSAFLWVHIYLLLCILDIQLRILGFEKLFPAYIKLFPASKGVWKSKDVGTLQREISSLINVIDKVCAAYHREAQCLHRSFLGYRLLRKKYGMPVDLVIGVRKFPFAAHAWLMLNDSNVNEPEEYTSNFIVILKSSQEGEF